MSNYFNTHVHTQTIIPPPKGTLRPLFLPKVHAHSIIPFPARTLRRSFFPNLNTQSIIPLRTCTKRIPTSPLQTCTSSLLSHSQRARSDYHFCPNVRSQTAILLKGVSMDPDEKCTKRFSPYANALETNTGPFADTLMHS